MANPITKFRELSIPLKVAVILAYIYLLEWFLAILYYVIVTK
jgi:hypothetical protein